MLGAPPKGQCLDCHVPYRKHPRCYHCRPPEPVEHQGLVRLIAKEFQQWYPHLERVDLVSEGQFGLLRACELFDPAREVKFSAYARYWIRASIQEGIQERWTMIYVPDYLYRVSDGVFKERIKPANLTPKQQEALQCAEHVFSHPVLYESANGGRTAWAQRASNPWDAADARLDAEKMLGELAPRERLALALRFGLDGEPPHLNREVGERLGMTREGARLMIDRTLDVLRARFREGA